MSEAGQEIMIVAGEASGDHLGADLAKGIGAKRSGVTFFGTPGPAMRAAGVESVFDSDSWSVVGIGAVLKAAPRFLQILSELRRVANVRKPAAVILIDFPEFNLKLASKLKKDGHRVIYYVSPQVWAWRKYRVRTIRESVDLLVSILPFEKEWYEEQGIHHVEFVGNPVVNRTKPTRSKEEILEEYGLDGEKRLVALLPGSRRKEIRRHLPVMVDVAQSSRNDPVQCVIAAADSRSRLEIEQLLSGVGASDLNVIEGDAVNVLNASDAAIISSGTATLEAAILGTPMVVVYRLPRVDYALFRSFVQTPFISLINLIAGRRLVSELIQDDLNPDNLARELNKLLSPEGNKKMRSELREAVASFRTENAPDPADLVIKFLDGAVAHEGQRSSP